MYVRLMLEDDIDEVIEMARANVEETRADLEWHEGRMRLTIAKYFSQADPTFFVCEEKGRLIGFLMAGIYEYRAMAGLFTTQEVIYVRSARRGSRAAVLLMNELIAWSQRLGAKEIIGGNDNDFHSDRTARFLEHFGFVRVGYALKRVL